MNTSTTDLATDRSGVMAGGNWIVDHVKMVDRWPPQDALANISDQFFSNGGSAYNMLKDLARLGVRYPLEAVGLVGNDEAGRFIRDDCARHSVDTSQLTTSPSKPTSYTDVMTVKESARRTFFHCRGANAELGCEHFNFSATRARFFHLGYLLLLDRLDEIVPGKDGTPSTGAAELLRTAKERGMKTSVDLVSESGERFMRVVQPALPFVDYLFLNEFEAAQVTGVTTVSGGQVDRPAIEKAAEALVRAGLKGWVFVHFPAAVFGCNGDGERIWQPALRVPGSFVRGTAGAGDAFAAGVVYGLHEDWSIERCLQLGVCTAAASLAHPTCSEGVTSKDECLSLADRFGFVG